MGPSPALVDVVNPGHEGDHLILNGVAVECHTDVDMGANRVFPRGTFGGEPAFLLCGYVRGTTRAVLYLVRTDDADPMFFGRLRGVNGGPEYEVRSHSFDDRGHLWGKPLGYAIGFADGRAHVRIETAGRGRVWIDPAAPDRDLLAAAAASLLLFRQ
jgi:hypothetical protein